MQKKKMVTSLLVAGLILANSFSGFLDVANAQVKHRVTTKPHVTTAKKSVVSAQKTSKKPVVSSKKTSKKYVVASKKTTKKYVSAKKTNKKVKVTRRSKRRAISRSRGGNPLMANRLVEFAKTQLGKPYVWGASGPNAFDCSGFTSYVYRNFGITLPHNSTSQSNYGTTVSRAALIPGDLLFFATSGSKTINHVGIYIGDDKFIHGSSGRSQVFISDLSNYTKYAGDFITAKRIL